jgi:hypothetical protein
MEPLALMLKLATKALLLSSLSFSSFAFAAAGGSFSFRTTVVRCPGQTPDDDGGVGWIDPLRFWPDSQNLSRLFSFKMTTTKLSATATPGRRRGKLHRELFR